MLFEEVAECYAKLESVSSRLVMIEILSELLKKSSGSEIKKLVYMTQGVLLPPFEGIEFGVAERILEEAIGIATGYSKEDVEKSYKKYGDIGEAVFSFKKVAKLKKMANKRQSVSDVYDTMYKIASTSGAGSKNLKVRFLSEILASSSPLEAKYIARYPIGQLRLGVGDSTIIEALSLAFTGSRNEKETLESAYNLCSDLGVIAEELALNGMDKIRNFQVSLFKPIRPALAERLPTPEEIIKKMNGKCAVEQKYDGFRCQIHKKGGIVKIYSRNLEETTNMFPDIQKAALNIKPEMIILEGEALAFNESTGEFLPFQETIQRKRKHGIKEKVEEMPLHLFAFDLLYINGKSYIKEPYETRRADLEDAIKGSKSITPTNRIVTSDPKEFEEFFESSIENGLEGIVAKDLNAPYVAGARKFSWIKMKRSYKGILSDTVDLVIVGYFLGKGSRSEFGFGGLLCAVYNKKRDMFETISKIGTGFTEEHMGDFKTLLDKIIVKHKPARVDSVLKPDFWVDPRYVIEVMADEITKSPTHTCGREKNELGIDEGYALRFPRIVGDGFIRKDKNPEDATSTEEIIEIFKQQKKVGIK
jgi:DNA ligase-1